MKTIYIVQTFSSQGTGKKAKLMPDAPISCRSADEARNRAERMADQRAGVIAASQEYDDGSDEYGKFEVLAQYGEIPPGILDREISTFKALSDAQKYALEFSSSYADEFTDNRKTGRCAIFCGKPGTGKTHLSIGIAKQAMEQGYTALFMTVYRAIRQVKDSWNKASNTTEQEVIDSLVFPDLLILDEVGVQFGSETEKLILFDVLNERYENRKPTLLLSNLTINEVKTYLGERIFDRLREDKGAVVSFDWESHRGATA